MNQLDVDDRIQATKSNVYQKNRKGFVKRGPSKSYPKYGDSNLSINEYQEGLPPVNTKKNRNRRAYTSTVFSRSLNAVDYYQNDPKTNQMDNSFYLNETRRALFGYYILDDPHKNDDNRNTNTNSSSSSRSFGTNGSPINKALPPIVAQEQNKNTLLDPLFGQSEFDRLFPKQTLKIAILTWNMSSKAPENYTTSIERLLRLDNDSPLADVYVLGLQETPKSDLIQCQLKMGIQSMLGPNFVLLRWEAMGVLHCSIWIRRELLWSCTTVRSFSVNSRPVAANRIKTKGALALSVDIFGTAFLFINTHLSAHTANLRTRMNQMDKIQQTLGVQSNRSPNKPDQSRNGSTFRNPGNSDYIFWFGDLNFRLEKPLEKVMESIHKIAKEMEVERRDSLQTELMRSDQLTKLMSRAIIFSNFNEAIFPPPFLPTYKCRERTVFDLRSDTVSANSGYSSASSYNTKNVRNSDKTPSTSSSETTEESPRNIRKMLVEPLKDGGLRKFSPTTGIYKEGFELDRFEYNVSRVPSFTDRILYQKGSHDAKDVSCDVYTAISSLYSSDHKPVYASFEVAITPAEVDFENVDLDALKQNAAAQNSPKENVPSMNKGVSSFFRFRKRPGLAKTNNEILSGRALSVSTSSLIATSLANSSTMERLTNSSKQRAFIDRITELNAGEFDRQIYIDGLKLRSAVFAFRDNFPKAPMDFYDDLKSNSLEMEKLRMMTIQKLEPRTIPTKEESAPRLYKSLSTDFTFVSIHDPRFLPNAFRQNPRRYEKIELNGSLNSSLNIKESPDNTKLPNIEKAINRTQRPPPSPSRYEPTAKSSLCSIS